MSKAAINYNKINVQSLSYLKDFMSARIAVAKEDVRHKDENKRLGAKLEEIHKDRESDLAQGIPLDDVIRKHSTVEAENAIRKEENRHKEVLKPLNEALKDTYAFMPEGMYDSYARKIEFGKRGNFIECVKGFLENIGIEEVSQSALCKLSEQLSDYLGVCVSTSKKLLEDKVFASTLRKSQFNKLFMSVFCDILVENKVLEINL